MNRPDCPNCEKYRRAGYAYCGNCGKSQDCPYCEHYRMSGSAYCRMCGKPLHVTAPLRTKRFSAARSFGILSATVTSLFLVIAAVALYAYAIDIFLYLSDKAYGMLILIPYPYTFAVISGTGLQLYWVLLFVIITLSLMKLVHETYLYFREHGLGGNGTEAKKPGICWIGLMWPATIFLQIVIIYVSVILTGVDLTVPELSMDQRGLMFLLADASVWEELITRVLIIGVPLFIIGLTKMKKDSWKFLLGGFGVDKLSMMLVVISALVFGYAHEAGWGFSKVIPSFLFGLAAGYLFVEYGLYAAVLIHFVNDYLMAFVWLGGSETLMGLASLGLIALGALATVVLAVKMWRFLKDFRNRPNYPKGLE